MGGDHGQNKTSLTAGKQHICEDSSVVGRLEHYINVPIFVAL